MRTVFYFQTRTFAVCCVNVTISLINQRSLSLFLKRRKSVKSAHGHFFPSVSLASSYTVPPGEEGFIWETLSPPGCSHPPLRKQSCSSPAAVSQYWLQTTNVELIMSHVLPLCFFLYSWICLIMSVTAGTNVFLMLKYVRSADFKDA